MPDLAPGARDADEQARELAARSRAGGDPLGWFEALYAAAARGQAEVPWDRAAPHPLLVEWAVLQRADSHSGAGRSALVVGSGLGDDAEFVAGLGYRTTGFDVSDSAVTAARARFPGSAVSYRTANLLDLPPVLRAGFDLVVEIMTVQALPVSVRPAATAAVAGLPGPGGALLVIGAAVDEPTPLAAGPPWPLTLAEVKAFASGGLEMVRIDDIRQPESRRRWRAEFRRPHG